MAYRIVENKEGFEVQKYFELKKQTWLDRFINGERASGWCTLDIYGRLWGVSIDGYLGMAFTEKKACFETPEEAQKFLVRITRKEKIIYQV